LVANASSSAASLMTERAPHDWVQPFDVYFEIRVSVIQ
jgi:hypothetical protein